MYILVKPFLLLLPLLFSDEWIARLSAIIEKHIWEKPEVIWTLFILYHVCLAADLMVKYKSGKLTVLMAWNTFLSYLGKTVGAIASLFVANFLSQIMFIFGWVPQLIMSALAGVVAVQTFKFMSQLKVLPMAVYVLLDQKINKTLNSQILEEDEIIKKHQAALRDAELRLKLQAERNLPAGGADQPVSRETTPVVP